MRRWDLHFVGLVVLALWKGKEVWAWEWLVAIQYSVKPDNQHKWVWAACYYLSQLSRERVESYISIYSNNISSMEEKQVIHDNLLCKPPSNSP